MKIEEKLRKELAEVKDYISRVDAFSKPDFASKNKRFGELEKIIELFDQKNRSIKAIDQAKELISGSDKDMRELAELELTEQTDILNKLDEQIRLSLIPKDPNDEKNCIVEIRAGAGGDEASLFASELLRMYLRYCERSKLKVEIINETPNDAGGYKEVIFEVKGDSPYAKLKFESGVHRVQRVPTTESQGRVHTSTVTVAVMPEAEDADVEISDTDIRVDVYRSSGHGGQSVNTTDSAVRITHIPTGLVVTCQDGKNQLKNKEKALSVLRSRLMQIEIDKKMSEESETKRKLIGSGDRSEKIRTYNFPQDRITDHRISYSRSNMPDMLTGNFDDLTDVLRKAELENIESTVGLK
jgi:peptide chain release factor 1